MFENRIDAARKLLPYLQDYQDQDAVVLAVPRGGVPLGHHLASSLALPLEIVLTKKIGHPAQKELAVGAVSMGSRLVDERFSVDEDYLIQETARIREDLRRKYVLFRGNRAPVALRGRHLIICDDGIATGSTMLATVQLLGQDQPASITIAVPVCSRQASQLLEPEVDHLISLLTPANFKAVSHYYQQFAQVTDEEVVAWLHA